MKGGIIVDNNVKNRSIFEWFLSFIKLIIVLI